MGLSENLEQLRQTIVHEANNAIANLITIANSSTIQMEEIASRLKEVKKNLESDTFKLIIVGRFKTGKSSLINALLGPLPQQQGELQTNKGPMPIDDLPTTATLTSIRYSEKPYVRVWYSDENKKPEYWTVERYTNDSIIRTNEEETKQFFENIRQFEFGYPAELCRSVTLLDSPGTSDTPLRTKWTREAVRRCDAAIVLYRSEPFAGEDERNFAKEVLDSGTRVFTLINLWNSKVPDQRFLDFAWDRLVQGDRRLNVTVDDLTNHNIYFIDALKAHKGKFTGNHKLIKESGLEFFENRLAKFLRQEKFQTHIEKFIREADNLAIQIENDIEVRCSGLQQDGEKLAHTYQEIKPKLENVKKRKDKLSTIFDRYERLCQTELQLSFTRMLNALREDLPRLLEDCKIQSLKGLGGTFNASFHPKAACEEAAKICESIITSRVEAWSKESVQQTLQPIRQKLENEITEEVAKIDADLQKIRFQMTDFKPEINTPKSTTSLIERILCAGAGLAMGDFSLFFWGSRHGLRGILGNIGGAIVAGIGLGIAAIMGAPLTLSAITIAAIFGSEVGSVVAVQAGLEKRIKKEVLKQAQEKLQNIPKLAEEKIDNEVRKTFGNLKSLVVDQVSLVIRQEEETYQKMLEDNQRSREDKQLLLKNLTNAKKQIATQRKLFDDTLVKVKQVS